METLTCCNDAQQGFLILYGIYLLLVLVTWNSLLAKPMRLLATAIHEFSHALVCWCTGGQVDSIHVYENEGGVTRYRGGCRCCIAPAGYLGEAVWGTILVVMSASGRTSATVAAALLMSALSLSLCYAPNRTLCLLNTSHVLLIAGAMIVEYRCGFFLYSSDDEEQESSPSILMYLIDWYGVCLGTYAWADTWAHLVAPSQPSRESDAYALHEETKKGPLGLCCCCHTCGNHHTRCIGFSWFITAVLCQWIGLYMALLLSSDECRQADCLFYSDWQLDWKHVWENQDHRHFFSFWNH